MGKFNKTTVIGFMMLFGILIGATIAIKRTESQARNTHKFTVKYSHGKTNGVTYTNKAELDSVGCLHTDTKVICGTYLIEEN